MTPAVTIGPGASAPQTTAAHRLRQLVSGLSAEQRELLATLLEESRAGAVPAPAAPRPAEERCAPTVLAVPPADMQFSLFFFSEDTQGDGDRYRLLLESARLADELGYTAIWTPERHFDRFGGSYPNPSVLAAALAVTTTRLQLRAGSVVMPLHHPIRVAEEWAVVDNLSAGRVGMACASGWHLADFVLAADRYEARKDVTWRNLEIVQRLWRGEVVHFPGVNGEEVSVATFPRPIQPKLPMWLTATGSPDTFRKAGELGLNVLTHLTAQSVEELEEHIAVYRAALANHGWNPADRSVTLMLHTFVGEYERSVKETVRGPMYDYLRSNLGLHARQARERKSPLSVEQFTADDRQAMLEHAFERYYEHRALFGAPATCLKQVNRLKEAGVTEIACLVDFGLDRERVLDGVRCLGALIAPPVEHTDS